MFKDFKNKRYWILMPPFLLTALLLFKYLPSDNKFIYSMLVIVLFWIVYYLWNFFADNNKYKDS